MASWTAVGRSSGREDVEDGGDELALQVIEEVVHVGNCGSRPGVGEQVGLAGLAEQ